MNKVLTRRGHESTKNFNRWPGLALLWLLQNFDALFASFLTETLDVIRVLVCLGSVRIDSPDENLRCPESFFFSDGVRGLEDL